MASINRHDGLRALNTLLEDEIHPAEDHQVKRIGEQQLRVWLERNDLPAKAKEQIADTLRPVVTHPDLVAVHVSGAKHLDGGDADVIVLGVPPDVREGSLDTHVVILSSKAPGPTDFPSGPIFVPTCRYNKCADGLCVTATRFQKTCPPNECPSANCPPIDAGSGFQALNAL